MAAEIIKETVFIFKTKEVGILRARFFVHVECPYSTVPANKLQKQPSLLHPCSHLHMPQTIPMATNPLFPLLSLH